MLRKIILSFCCYAVVDTYGAFAQQSQAPNYSDSTITIPASEHYKAHLLWRIFFGNHYRDSWSAPVSIHYLDLEHMKGGLTPVKLGGGFQTKSLSLNGADSIVYVIRTVDKDPSKVVDTFLRETFVTDIIRDQISASHPYGFLAVPVLADGAEIYHTDPQVYYVPDDPNLGPYREIFKNKVVLFEEYEPGNSKGLPSLRGFKAVVSTEELNDLLITSSNYKVDERLTLRSRLIDMLIGDWDRHEDNWRWVQFEMINGDKIFRPIPRDRDQAFFHFDGFLPWFTKIWVPKIRKMQYFTSMPRSIKWFNYNARYFDQNYLSELSRTDWKQVADSLTVKISDSVIDSAVRSFPDTIYQLTGKEIAKTLKERRDNLPRIADKYYLYLAKKVNINGTNNADYFEIIRSSPDSTEVNVYQINTNGQKEKRTYHRIFNKAETKEILLHGYKGNDVYEISGKAHRTSCIKIMDDEVNTELIRNSVKKNRVKKLKILDKVEKGYTSKFNSN